MDLVQHLYRQRAFSRATFGPGERTNGLIDHIKKELKEIKEAAEGNCGTSLLEEWIDVAILAMDGAWRSGASPEEIAACWARKQDKNEVRNWPDWRTSSQDKAIEHIR